MSLSHIPENNSPQNQINTVIFDLAGVLFEMNKIKILTKIGILNSIWYVAKYRRSPLKKCFNILSSISDLDNDPSIQNLYFQENRLPQCITLWQEGKIDCKKIIDILEFDMENLNQKHQFFADSFEENYIKKILKVYVDAQECKDALKPIQKLHSLAYDLKTKGYKLYILSNQAEETFAMLEQKYAAFFTLFSGILISARAHIVKPEAAIYNLLIDTYHIDPKTSLFIDDQEENLIPARSLGIASIKFENANSLKKQLFTMNIL